MPLDPRALESFGDGAPAARDADLARRLLNLERLLSVPAATPYVTTLPPLPRPGQEVIYGGGSDAFGAMPWRLRYNPDNPGSYKWEAIGPTPIMYQGGSYAGSSAAIVEFTPRLTFPLSGLYQYEFGCRPFQQNGAGVAAQVWLLRNGATTGVAIDSYQGSAGTTTTLHAVHQVNTGRNVEVAGNAFSLGASVSSGSVTVGSAWFRITPIYLA